MHCIFTGKLHDGVKQTLRTAARIVAPEAKKTVKRYVAGAALTAGANVLYDPVAGIIQNIKGALQ